MCPPRPRIAVARHCTPPLCDCPRWRLISTARRASMRATSPRVRLQIPGTAIIATRRADTRSCYGPNGAALPLQAMLSAYRTLTRRPTTVRRIIGSARTGCPAPRTMTPRRYSNLSELLALLLDLLERLRESLERILIGRRSAATRRALHRQVGAFAHGIDHTRLLGDVLDPGTIVLRVHRELDGADLGGGVGAGLERIADDDRHFVFYVFGRTG